MQLVNHLFLIHYFNLYMTIFVSLHIFVKNSKHLSWYYSFLVFVFFFCFIWIFILNLSLSLDTFFHVFYVKLDRNICLLTFCLCFFVWFFGYKLYKFCRYLTKSCLIVSLSIQDMVLWDFFPGKGLLVTEEKVYLFKFNFLFLKAKS